MVAMVTMVIMIELTSQSTLSDPGQAKLTNSWHRLCTTNEHTEIEERLDTTKLTNKHTNIHTDKHTH